MSTTSSSSPHTDRICHQITTANSSSGQEKDPASKCHPNGHHCQQHQKEGYQGDDNNDDDDDDDDDDDNNDDNDYDDDEDYSIIGKEVVS